MLQVAMQSNITQLKPFDEGILKMNLKIPVDYPHKYITLFFNLKSEDRVIEPNFDLYLKIFSNQG